MAGVFHFVSNLGSKRDDYGVGDLLAEVSKRSSSISSDDRQEIAEISKRLRQHRPGCAGTSQNTPRQTPDNSQHDIRNKPNMNYGKDLLKVDDLLRGFGSIHSPVEKQDGPLSPPFSPKIVDNDTRPAGVMLRDFGPPGTQVATSDTKMIDCGYGQARHV